MESLKSKVLEKAKWVQITNHNLDKIDRARMIEKIKQRAEKK